MENEIRILEIFAGSKSFSNVANSKGFKTFSVDWNPFKGIDLVADVENLKIDDFPFVPDVVWASPDCTTYSIASCSTHRSKTIEPKTEYAQKCDQVNKHLIGLINEWLKINSDMIFFIENPRGMLRKMPFMQEFKRQTIWYCQYGDNRAKPTDIWTNCNTWIPRPACHNGNKNCHHQPSPRGSKNGTQGLAKFYERSKIPKQLCEEILNVIEKKLAKGQN